jgi:lysophospholipid acyltransferase
MLGPPSDKRKSPGPFPAAITFMVSAIWHGFYPGYSLFFATGAFFSWKSKFAEKTIYPKAL